MGGMTAEEKKRKKLALRSKMRTDKTLRLLEKMEPVDLDVKIPRPAKWPLFS